MAPGWANGRKRTLLLFWLFSLAAPVIAAPADLPARAEEISPPPDRREEGPGYRIGKLELKQAKVKDALRLIEELSGINAVATEAAGSKPVSLFLQDVTARQAIDTLAKISGLWHREDPATKTFRIMTTEEFQKDLIIFREDLTRVFNLLHHNTISMAQVISDLYGQRVILSFGIDDTGMRMGMGTGMGIGGAGVGGGGMGVGAGAGRNASQGSLFSRPVTGSPFMQGMPAGGGTGTARDPGRLLKESLTSDQIDKLMKRLEEAAPEGKGDVSSEILHGIAKSEAPIYVTVVRQHNVVIVRTADARVMKDIEVLIKELDRPTRQVLLEMKILRLGIGDSFRSIFDFDVMRGPSISGPPTGQPPNIRVPDAPVGPKNLLGLGNFPLEGGTFLYQFMNDAIRARIQLLAQQNRLEVLATPMILASNNRPAQLFVGEQRVLVTGVRTQVVTPANGASTTVIEPITEVRDIGNTLNIQPMINADRTVTLFISQDSSSVLLNSATIPVATQSGDVKEIPIDTVSTAILQGAVVAKDGLSVAVGGLIQNNVSRDQQKVPFLAEIPVLGWLFRREVRDKSRSELILLITPHVLMTPIEGAATTDALTKEESEHPYFKQDDPASDHEMEKSE